MTRKQQLSLPQEGNITLADLLSGEMAALKKGAVLVVGDVMLDHYLWGEVERTTPEAPVPVVRHERDSWALGGAANVAHNIVSLGGKAVLIGAIGKDPQGEEMLRCLKEARISARSILTIPGRPTTVKTRVVSMGQQILRIDKEDVTPLKEKYRVRLRDCIAREMARCGAVILSDYGKNTLDTSLVQAVVEEARKRNLPILADPKGANADRYKGVDVLTPNWKEAALLSGIPIRTDEDLEKAGRALLRRCRHNALIITRDAEGIVIMQPRRKTVQIPAHAPEVFDETGAGDTFIATLALCLAAGLSFSDAAVVANRAGNTVVGKLGVASLMPGELKTALEGGAPATKVRTVSALRILVANQQTRGRKVVFTNGFFDLLHPGHIRFLHNARKQGDLLVVGLNTDRSVRAVKGPGRPILPLEERAAILSALAVVDYVVFFDEETPESLLRELRPDILAKGENIPQDEIVGREIVEAYGGEVRRLPILEDSAANDLVGSILGRLSPGKKSGRK